MQGTGIHARTTDFAAIAAVRRGFCRARAKASDALSDRPGDRRTVARLCAGDSENHSGARPDFPGCAAAAVVLEPPGLPRGGISPTTW